MIIAKYVILRQCGPIHDVIFVNEQSTSNIGYDFYIT